MKKRFLNGKMKVLALAGAVLMLCSFTQVREKYRGSQEWKGKQFMQLSEEQQSQMKAIRVKHLEETQSLRNELAELEVHQKTLMTTNKPGSKGIETNVDKISRVKTELMKKRLAMRVEMNAQLTEEQRVLRAGKSFGPGCKGRMGRSEGLRQGHQFGHKGKGNFAGRSQQGGKKMHMRKGNQQQNKGMMNFSDQQKEQMKQLKIAHLKDIQPLKNELKELKVKQQNVMTMAKPNLNTLLGNADKMGEIQNQMMKEKVNHQLEVQKLLTEEQRVLWNARFLNKRNKGEAPCIGRRRG